MPIVLKPVTLEALPVLSRYLPQYGNGDCNLTAAALISRQAERVARWAEVDGCFVLRWLAGPSEPLVWQMPLGQQPGLPLIEKLEAESLAAGEPLRLYGSLPELLETVNRLMPYRTFTVSASNSWWDYLYTRESFITFEGRRLNGKRNFRKRFWAANPQARFLPISSETLPLCRQFLAEWYAGYGEVSGTMQDEAVAISLAFDHFGELGLQGGVLESEGRVCGFTYGARTSKDIFAVHIEKAARDVPGAYPVLANELAKSLPEDITWLNREEDLGIPGLRKAKQDWAPSRMLRKGYLTIKPL